MDVGCAATGRRNVPAFRRRYTGHPSIMKMRSVAVIGLALMLSAGAAPDFSPDPTPEGRPPVVVASPPPPSPTKKPRVIPRERFLAEVRSHLGFREARHGVTPFGRWYARRVDDRSFATGAWCDMFLGYCAHRTGTDRRVGVHALTTDHAKAFHAAGRFDRTPRVGSIVFFDWQGSRNRECIDHVGVVEKVRPDGSVVTLEGNIGDRVDRHLRTTAHIVGFGHPRW